MIIIEILLGASTVLGVLEYILYSCLSGIQSGKVAREASLRKINGKES
jgi:hypothetical protein